MTDRTMERPVMRVLAWLLGAAALSCAPADAGAPEREARPVMRPPVAKAELPVEELGPDVRYVVSLGGMRIGSNPNREDLGRVLHDSARAHARMFQGAAVVEADGALVQRAGDLHLPVITLDGVVTLTESPVGGGLQIRASVEFSVRRDQVLKAILTGAASALGSSPTISDRGRRQLEAGAIDGAVQVALRGADRELMVAAR